MLVSLIEGTYEVHHGHGFMWHNIVTRTLQTIWRLFTTVAKQRTRTQQWRGGGGVFFGVRFGNDVMQQKRNRRRCFLCGPFTGYITS
jgi:hypothetical protein